MIAHTFIHPPISSRQYDDDRPRVPGQFPMTAAMSALYTLCVCAFEYCRARTYTYIYV